MIIEIKLYIFDAVIEPKLVFCYLCTIILIHVASGKMDSDTCKRLVETVDHAYKFIRNSSSSNEEIRKWYLFGVTNIRLIKKYLYKTSDLSTNQKQCLISTIGLLLPINQKFQRLGKGLSEWRKRSERVKWLDLESVIEGRIRTGVGLNLAHKDLDDFLSDAQKCFHTRMRKVLREQLSIEVNFGLNCTFAIHHREEITEEVKHFTTSNQPSLASTNLNEWFETNIRSKLLSRIEDFQEKD